MSLEVGDRVRILAGPHAGESGKVIATPGAMESPDGAYSVLIGIKTVRVQLDYLAPLSLFWNVVSFLLVVAVAVAAVIVLEILT